MAESNATYIGFVSDVHRSVVFGVVKISEEIRTIVGRLIVIKNTPNRIE